MGETVTMNLSDLIQWAITIGAIVFSHGMLHQRVRTLESSTADHQALSKIVARLEAELEGVGREIKNLRDDFRRVLDELTRLPVRRA